MHICIFSVEFCGKGNKDRSIHQFKEKELFIWIRCSFYLQWWATVKSSLFGYKQIFDSLLRSDSQERFQIEGRRRTKNIVFDVSRCNPLSVMSAHLSANLKELLRKVYLKNSSHIINHTFPAVSMMSNETNWPSINTWCRYVASVWERRGRHIKNCTKRNSLSQRSKGQFFLNAAFTV